jgi:RNA polymerase sigma factor (sigma-70 family)
MIDNELMALVPDAIPAGGLAAVLLANRAALVGFMRSHGADEAAEDLFQDLWLKIELAPGGPITQPLSYLYRAANNLMLDRYRATRQAVKREQDWSATADVSVEPPAERGLIAREQLVRAEATLAGLGTRASTLFRRHRLDGVPQRDLAAEFGISLSTVESDLRIAYRAMIELRQRFAEEELARPTVGDSVIAQRTP